MIHFLMFESNEIGFGESMAGLVGLDNNKWAIRAFGAGAVLLLGVINVAGVKWVIKHIESLHFQ